MSTTDTHPTGNEAPTGGVTPAEGRRHRRRRTLLAGLATLVAVLLALPIVADAAVTTFAAHDHGTLDVVIDGETVDLDQPRFHDLHPEFHVHPGDGNRWHHHPRTPLAMFRFEPMTLREALTAMGIEHTADAFAFDGVVHDTSHPATGVTVLVNGAEVDVDGHVIGDHDHITVEVTTS